MRTLSLLSWALATVLALSMGASRAAAADEPVSFAPAFSPGGEWTYDLSVDLVVSQGERVTRIVQSAQIVLRCEQVDESGRAGVKGALSRLTWVWTDADGQLEYTWSKADDPEADKAAAADEAFTEAGRALALAELAMLVAPDGAVVGVSGLEGAVAAVAAESRFGARALGLFEPAQFTRSIQLIWRADDNVAAPRRQGEGWQVNQSAPMGPAGELRITTDLVVTELSDNSARYTGRESAQIATPDEPAPTAPTVSLEEQSGAVQGAWNREVGALDSRTAERRLAMIFRLGDMALPQTQTSKVTLSLVGFRQTN